MCDCCRIAVRTTKDSKLASAAVVVMCTSPASVFMTYSYTESAFSMLTFAGVLLLQTFPAVPLLAAGPLALSCVVRSNGSSQLPASKHALRLCYR